jgi:hypothetical protein
MGEITYEKTQAAQPGSEVVTLVCAGDGVRATTSTTAIFDIALPYCSGAPT